MRKTDSRPSTPNPQQPADQQVNALDPRQIPVWHEATSQVQQQHVLGQDRLSLSAVRQRFANPLPWQPEQRRELLPWQQPPRDAAVLLGLQPLQQAPDQLRVLLTQRTEHLKSHAGQIAFPGGKIDPDDADAVAAALREAEEESGLSIGAVEFLCLSEQIIAEERQHWVSLIYMTEDFSGEARVVEPEKLPEFGWFPLDALPAPLSRFAADAVKALRERHLARSAAS